MSLAERPQARVVSAGIGARRRQGWGDEFQVETAGLAHRRPKQAEEALPAQVDSKDLFREASNLPNSDDVQVNLGRFLHHYRNTRAHYFQGSFVLTTETRPAPPEEWTVPSAEELWEFVAEIRRALGVSSDADPSRHPSEVVSHLRKVLRSIESRKTLPVEARTVLESFDGYVDSIDGGTAYVTLESRLNGDVLYGEYPAQEILSKGIREQTRFLCETVNDGGAGRVHFAPLPSNHVTDEEARSIAREMCEAFPGDDNSVIEY